MNYQYVEGYHAPKGVTAEQAWFAVQETPNPDEMLEASKNPDHCLHTYLWTEGDQVWANKARREACRKFISAAKSVRIVGGREISVRAVEFIKVNGQEIWAKFEDIEHNPDYLQAYFREVNRLLQQAMDKVAVVEELMKK